MAGDCALADHQRGRDLAVALPRRNEPQNLELPPRQTMGVRESAAQMQRVDAGDIRRRAELREDLTCRRQLQCRRVLIAERPAREGDLHARTRDFVRRVEVSPRVRGTARRGQPDHRVVRGQCHGGASVLGHGGEDVCALAIGDLVELTAGAARSLDVTGLQHDLDVRGQERSTRQRRGRLAHRSPDRGGSHIVPPLRQAQQRQPRLGLTSVAIRFAVRRLGGTELAA
jgi:hypothetical protein